MNAIGIALIAFTCIFGSALLGMSLHRLVPKHHLSSDSKDVMNLGTGMIATTAALVLGLLVSSAKGTFDTLTSELTKTSVKISLLDRTMANYGPETKEARDILRRNISNTIRLIWPGEKSAIALENVNQGEKTVEDIEKKIRQLSPQNPYQRELQSQALRIIGEIEEARLTLILQVGKSSSLPALFLVLLICWLVIIFFNFALFATPNKLVVTIFFVSTLSIASSLYLILELDQPYSGLIKISSSPLVNTLMHLGK
jgi:hypothetical protein